MSDAQLAGESQKKSEPNRALEYVVRFGSMRILGVMASKQPYRYGDEVVVRSSRGTEIPLPFKARSVSRLSKRVG